MVATYNFGSVYSIDTSIEIEVMKKAKIRNRNNQVPQLTL